MVTSKGGSPKDKKRHLLRLEKMVISKGGSPKDKNRHFFRPTTPAEEAARKKASANRGSEGPKQSVRRSGTYAVIRPANYQASPAETRAKELSRAVASAKKRAAANKAGAEGPKVAKKTVAKKTTAPKKK